MKRKKNSRLDCTHISLHPLVHVHETVNLDVVGERMHKSQSEDVEEREVTMRRLFPYCCSVGGEEGVGTICDTVRTAGEDWREGNLSDRRRAEAVSKGTVQSS